MVTIISTIGSQTLNPNADFKYGNGENGMRNVRSMGTDSRAIYTVTISGPEGTRDVARIQSDPGEGQMTFVSIMTTARSVDLPEE